MVLDNEPTGPPDPEAATMNSEKPPHIVPTKNKNIPEMVFIIFFIVFVVKF